MALNRPVHAAETADGTTEPAVAAPGTAGHGDLGQTPPPPPPPRLLALASRDKS